MKNINIRSLFYSILISFAIMLIVVMLKSNRSFLTELEITLSILSTVLFIFFSISFYFGLRLKNEDINLKLKFIEMPFDNAFGIDFDISEGLVSIIASILIWFIIGLTLSFLISIFATTIWLAYVLIMTCFFWVFKRAFRIAFIKSRICKGNVIKSIFYSLFYTALYIGWFYAVIEFSKIFS